MWSSPRRLSSSAPPRPPTPHLRGRARPPPHLRSSRLTAAASSPGAALNLRCISGRRAQPPPHLLQAPRSTSTSSPGVGCLSGSESDDSDWSIGWLEPQAPKLQTDGNPESCFAVLVPCYHHSRAEQPGKPEGPFLGSGALAYGGLSGSAHDTRIFRDTLDKYKERFPHPPTGKYYLVDSGYPNEPGYLAPYRGQKYHLPEFRQGRAPSGKKELFNYAHFSLCNVIGRAFGVLKQKWHILRVVPSYPIKKQTRIIIVCMALHNFIRESQLFDKRFDRCDRDENYIPLGHVVSTTGETMREKTMWT